MSDNEKLTTGVEKRKAVLTKQTAGDGKVKPEDVRRTRKQLKRAQRRLAKIAKAQKALPVKKEETGAAEEKKEDGQSA